MDILTIIGVIEVKSTPTQRWNGMYYRTMDYFESGYFSQYNPESNLVFIHSDSNQHIKYRLFKNEEPGHEWVIQTFESEQIRQYNCDNTTLCTFVVPIDGWDDANSFYLQTISLVTSFSLIIPNTNHQICRLFLG